MKYFQLMHPSHTCFGMFRKRSVIAGVEASTPTRRRRTNSSNYGDSGVENPSALPSKLASTTNVKVEKSATTYILGGFTVRCMTMHLATFLTVYNKTAKISKYLGFHLWAHIRSCCLYRNLGHKHFSPDGTPCQVGEKLFPKLCRVHLKIR